MEWFSTSVSFVGVKSADTSMATEPYRTWCSRACNVDVDSLKRVPRSQFRYC